MKLYQYAAVSPEVMQLAHRHVAQGLAFDPAEVAVLVKALDIDVPSDDVWPHVAAGLEPGSAHPRSSNVHSTTISAAISAKRSADALELIAKHLAPTIEMATDAESDVMNKLETVRLWLRNWRDGVRYQPSNYFLGHQTAVHLWHALMVDPLPADAPAGADTLKPTGGTDRLSDAPDASERRGDWHPVNNPAPWLKPGDPLADLMRFDEPIEVHYKVGEGSYGPGVRMPLGEAIEWSLFPRGGDLSTFRKFKASIREWRPL